MCTAVLDLAMKEVDRDFWTSYLDDILKENEGRRIIKEVWCLCHQSDLEGHRGLEGTLSKLLKGFFLLSARQKIRFLNGVCDTCLTKKQSMPVRMGVHVPSLTGYVGEKLYIYLVSMSETVRGNLYMLTAEDSFSQYCWTYLIPNKEAHTVGKVLMDRMDG